MTASEYEKEFIKGFQELCHTRSSWEVWQCLMSAWACSISNASDRSEQHWQAREDEYMLSIAKLGGVDVPAQLLAIVTDALEANPDQDFLGKLYMALELGNHWKGQFFTPYDVCEMMAQVSLDAEKAKRETEEKGWISICDPACGAGATLIAAANAVRRCGVNYQARCCFVGQDIDRVVAQMCYIQLSLLGCPGYVMVANTLSDPLTGPVLWPEEQRGRKELPDQELWFTPMWASGIWTMRRKCFLMDRIIGGAKKAQEQPVRFIFRFDGKRPEVEVVKAG